MQSLLYFIVLQWTVFLVVSMKLTNPVKTLKRKVILVGGYVGTNYYGLQMDHKLLNTPKFVPTIENELREALSKAGHITELNAVDLSKINWSRSSRTDKGVHAARIVFSAKLELPENIVPIQHSQDYSQPPRFPSVVTNTNQYLPKDIRLFSCMKINNGFAAREECYWREYEYIFPLQLLTEHTKTHTLPLSEQQGYVDRLNTFLRQFQGSHHFHNFHRVQRRDLSGKLIGPEYIPQCDPSSPFFTPLAGMKRFGGAGNDEDEEGDETMRTFSPFYFQDWKETRRPIHLKTHGVIYRCHAALTNVPSLSPTGPLEVQPFVKIKILGQSFLLNQIRLMVSAAVLSAKGILPDSFIPMALVSPIFFRLPLAPSQGLVLANAGFYGAQIGQRIAMSSHTSINRDEDWCLLKDPEYEQSQQFLESSIYQRIAYDWFHNDSALMSETLNEFGRYSIPDTILPSALTSTSSAPLTASSTNTTTIPDTSMSKVSPQDSLASCLLPVWSQIHQHYASVEDGEEMKRRERDYIRIQYLLKELYNSVGDNMDRIEYMRAPDLMKLRKKFPHRLFLPNALATMLTINFNTFPNEVINHTVKLLATQIIRNRGATLPHPSEDPIQSFLRRIENDIEIIKKKRNGNIEETKSTKSTGKLSLRDLQLWITAQHRVSSLFLDDETINT